MRPVASRSAKTLESFTVVMSEEAGPNNPDSSGPGVTTAGAASNSRFVVARGWASFIRDVGIILGVPAIIVVGMQLYDIQAKSFEAQIRANEAKMQALEAEINTLKETQYDRALTIIKSQREVFDLERELNINRILTLEETNKDLNGRFNMFVNDERERIKESTKKLDDINQNIIEQLRALSLLPK
jgi:hypothetical protein